MRETEPINDFSSEQRFRLRTEIAALMADYSAPDVTNERRVRIEAALAYKQEQLAALLQIPEKRRQNPIHRQKDWQDVLFLLNCRKARKEIERIKEALGGDSGAASFFIQNSDVMVGNHCIAHIEEVFEYRLREIRPLRRTFDSATGLTPERILTEFKLELGIKERHESLSDGLRSVVERLIEQLSHGALVFVEVTFGHVAVHDQHGLPWLLDEFWPALLDGVAGRGSGIHCLLVIVCGKMLYKKNLPETLACQRHTHEKCSLRELKLEFWRQHEIEQWLSRYPKLPAHVNVRNIAERVWEEKRSPSVIAHTLLQELELIFTLKPKGD